MVIRKILAAMLIAMMGSSLREAAHAQEQALKKKDLPAAVLNAFSPAIRNPNLYSILTES